MHEPPVIPTPPPIAPTSRFSQWLHEHPYSAIALSAGSLIILGAVVLTPPEAPESGRRVTWGGSGSVFFPSAQRIELQKEATSSPQFTETPFVPIPIYSGSTQGTPEEYTVSTLLEELVNRAPSPSSAQPSEEKTDPWATFTVNFSRPEVTAAPVHKRSPTQEAIYTYGNTIGAAIKAYESEHATDLNILHAHSENRADPSRQEAVKRVAASLEQFGAHLQTISAPKEFADAHALYSAAHVKMGTTLSAIANSSDDESFLSALLAYNASVEEGARRFSVLSGLFLAHDVTFTEYEGGSAFMFSPNSSL